MFIRQAAGTLFLLAIGSLPGFCQQFTASNPNFSIDGSILELADQHALKDIRVDLKQPDGTPVDSTVTQRKGEFKFSGLPSGNYILEVRLTGYEPLREPVVIKNSPRSRQNLYLIKHALAEKWTTSAAISAHQLSAPFAAQDEFDSGVNLLYDKSDYQGAITHFQRATKKFPDYYEAYAQEGLAYQNLKEMPAAEEALRKSADLSSGKYSEALILLSELLCNTNRYDEAAVFSRKAIAVEPSSWRGHFELARALLALQQFEDAEKSARHARDLNPDNSVIHSLLANIHISRHNLSALAEDLDAFLKIVPTGLDAEIARKRQDELQAILRRKEEQTRASLQGKTEVNSDEIADANDDFSDDDVDSDGDSIIDDSVRLPAQPPATPNMR